MSVAVEKAMITWSEMHPSQETANPAVEQSLSPEDKKRILKTRAQALAREPEGQEAEKGHLDIVQFKLAQETYAVERVYVREVYPLKDLTPVPCTPPFVLGIINLRGRIISVMDIKKLFSLPDEEPATLHKAIVLRTDGMELGILADVILGVTSIPLANVHPPMPTLTGLRAEYLKGVTSERLAILDVKRILSDKKIIVHEEVEA
ncbi:MAG: chemotaxis protein CheW [Candidatus Marsarchaeota archaeon]|nr:chemotaxis protein CheW [Candidatus Marsarchaeota archaeon]